MRFLVQVPDLDGFLYGSHCEDDLAQTLERFQALRASGRLLEGGLFADDRGGFLVVEAQTQGEAETTLSTLFDLERVRFQLHPILSLGQMGELFLRIKEEDRAAQEGPRLFPGKPGALERV